MKRILFLFTIFCTFSLQAHEKPQCAVFASLTEEVRNWTAQDQTIATPHQRFVAWANEAGTATPVSALLIHGLYNSPEAMSALVDTFTSHGMNTMVTRLAGHREADPEILKSQIQWSTWLEEVENEFLLARRLGHKVVLVGHSTGALLAAWIAAKYPQDTHALVLFSPAFGVHTVSYWGALASQFTRLSLRLKSGRLITGHAGIEVNKAAKAFAEWLPQHMTENLQAIPVWMVNTQLDVVIDKQKAREFMTAISQPPSALRTDIWLPYSAQVGHDSITTEKNPQLQPLKQSLAQFLESLDSSVN